MKDLKKKCIRNKFIINSKKGFTLLELIITLVLISIFFAMLSGISIAMSRAFKRTDRYTQAVTFKNFISDEIRNKLNLTRKIRLTIPKNNNNNNELKSQDFNENPLDLDLYKYDALFSNYGKIYTIKADKSRVSNNITYIDDIRNRKITVLRENDRPDGKIIDFKYPHNANLKGLIKAQEAPFINSSLSSKDKILDPYKNFSVDISFFAMYKYDYNTSKDSINGIRVRIVVYEYRNNKRYDYIDEIDDMEIKNLHLENGSFEATSGTSSGNEYRILYFSIN